MTPDELACFTSGCAARCYVSVPEIDMASAASHRPPSPNVRLNGSTRSRLNTLAWLPSLPFRRHWLHPFLR